MVATSTHYDLLGVDCTATSHDIAKAYKKKALVSHPDRVAPARREEATLTFQKLAEAFSCLRNEQERQRYDVEIGIKRSNPDPFVRTYPDAFDYFSQPPRKSPTNASPPPYSPTHHPYASDQAEDAFYVPPLSKTYASQSRSYVSPQSTTSYRGPFSAFSNGREAGSVPRRKPGSGSLDPYDVVMEEEWRRRGSTRSLDADCSSARRPSTRLRSPGGTRLQQAATWGPDLFRSPGLEPQSEYGAGFEAGYAAATHAARVEEAYRGYGLAPPPPPPLSPLRSRGGSLSAAGMGRRSRLHPLDRDVSLTRVRSRSLDRGVEEGFFIHRRQLNRPTRRTQSAERRRASPTTAYPPPCDPLEEAPLSAQDRDDEESKLARKRWESVRAAERQRHCVDSGSIKSSSRPLRSKPMGPLPPSTTTTIPLADHVPIIKEPNKAVHPAAAAATPLANTPSPSTTPHPNDIPVPLRAGMASGPAARWTRLRAPSRIVTPFRR